MNIAVFSDKFSGTLSAIEVLDIVQSKFLDSNINADFFSVTDGGQESTEIFKSHNFQTHESFEALNCDNSLSVVESLNINGSVFTVVIVQETQESGTLTKMLSSIQECPGQ